MAEKGEILNQRYELDMFLGKGGSSEVWKAKHIHLDKLVAVKLLKKDLMDNLQFYARFKQEAQIASSLIHENICSVSDFGFAEEGRAFLVMDFLEGESLATVLKRVDRVPVGAALSIIRQVLAGLKAAHEMGVVHRDVKPGNIFIAKKKSGKRVVKLVDFGISKMVSADKKDLGLTTTGTLLGTAFYLSPEQIMETKGVDHRTDLYAAGAVIYKVITGKAPFMGENFGEIAVKIVNDPLVDPRDLVEGLSAPVAKIIKKALEKDARARYESVDEMIKGIDAVYDAFQEDTIDSIYSPNIEQLILKPIERKRFRPGRKFKIAVVAASLVVVAAAASLLAFRHSNVAGENEAGSLKAGGGKAEKTAAGQSQKGVETGPARVSVTFQSVPEGTRIRLGDMEVEGDSLQVSRSEQPLEVTLLAEGYADKKVSLVPRSNLDVVVTLDPLPQPREPAAAIKTTRPQTKKAAAKPAKAAAKPAAEEQAPSKTSLTSEVGQKKIKIGKMDYARDFPDKETEKK
ncbi:MAG: serine/threonine-protein kinase [Pseudomonadota bacterium]